MWGLRLAFGTVYVSCQYMGGWHEERGRWDVRLLGKA